MDAFAFVYLTLIAWMVATLIYRNTHFNILSIFWFVVIGAIFTFIYVFAKMGVNMLSKTNK